MKSSIKDVYSLTPAQEGIYAQYFQSEDAKIYHFHILCEINKDVDIPLLKKSGEMVFYRHQALRTAFTVLKSTGAIKQVILENREPEFSVMEWDEPFSQAVLDRITEEASATAMDLQRDSLIRTIVIKFADRCFMLMRSHHIILDGWCFPIIIKDLQRFYQSLSEGVSEEELKKDIDKEIAAETSYAQYVSWIKKQDKNEAINYWQTLLSDYSVSHIFGKEAHKNNEDMFIFRTYLDSDLTQNAEAFARENRVSVNTVFETAFAITLQKFSGSDDVVFDKVVSGRNIPLKNIENTIGLFVNTVPARVKSDEKTTVEDLLRDSQTQTVNADKYGITALQEIYKACDIKSRTVDALFVFENYYWRDITDDMKKSLLSTDVIFINEQTEFNLAIAVFKENNQYYIRTTYARDVYTEAEISAFLRGYIHILGACLGKSKRICDISIADTDATEIFNHTAHTYLIPENSTLYSLFEKAATESSDRICIKVAERDITFRELLNFSERLDTRLRDITKGEKSVVAVIAERSVEMYAAIYGIIRGGNAYLPIDPDYPQERIDYIISDSNASAVVVQGKFTDKVKNIPSVDMTKLISTEASEKAPDCAALPEDTAYVIYTSGSTGNPKGAKISHRSAVNRILWMHDKYPLGANDVILQKTPYTFDVSVWEHFWWGICGGCLTVSKPGEHFLPAKILEEAEKNKVTHLHFVPSVFELFLNYLEAHEEERSKFSSVRYVFLSGEALSASLVSRFYRLFDYEKVTLHNLYGPTECAVDVTYYDCVPTDTDPVPIGKPVYNTQIHILDKYLNPTPIGVTGELCIAGDNVGQGYLNNPELTAERFIDNPFGEGKMYRTGDLAYYREDGNIVFVGRNDSQIKLNGQRIETGEIEFVIASVEGVESVAVIVKKVKGKDTLVAFYTGEKNLKEEITEYCSIKLPKYMVPSAVVCLDSMPLNYSGKLDRRLLSAYEVDFTAAADDEPPQNEKEKQICDAFRAVLGVEKVGRNSDFFDMGGTSLAMIALLSGHGFEDITPAEFMRSSTPAKVALIMQKKEEAEFEYLECLCEAENESRVMILLPFAGGGAEAFSNLVREVKNTDTDMSVYYIRYLHSLAECEKGAAEIRKAFRNKDVYIYSHCVGSAVAMQLLYFLEKDRFKVRHYFSGASLPLVKSSEFNTWNLVPDTVIKNKLIKAGADFGGFSRRKMTSLLRSFRRDTDFSSSVYVRFSGKLKTPVSIILSKNDMFTKNYAQAEMLWGRYFLNVSGVHFITTDSHYFQKTQAKELADIIFESI